LILKSIVRQQGLNESYKGTSLSSISNQFLISKGGLSSYSLIIMVLAFLKDYYNGNQSMATTSLGQLFMEMCDFYGNKFDPNEEGIAISLTERYKHALFLKNNNLAPLSI
jgi:DNA polymerase sigma